MFIILTIYFESRNSVHQTSRINHNYTDWIITMPLTFDPNFDTNPVIIDNTWSKKRKQKEIDNYARVAVTRRKREEVIGEIVQTPPAGSVQKKDTVYGVVSGIVPHIKNGHAVGEGYTLQPSVWHALHHPVTGITAVPYRNYVNYLKDPEYIEFVHKRVIGMIKAWVECIEETVTDLREDWGYSWAAVKDQLFWARRLTDKMMVGLSKFKLFPVTVLNLRSVVELIEGVDDEEKADLVVQIANCKKCEIAIIRHVKENNVSIVTIYDNNNTHKVAYGKGSIKDLNNETPADRGVGEIDEVHNSPVKAHSKVVVNPFSMNK